MKRLLIFVATLSLGILACTMQIPGDGENPLVPATQTQTEQKILAVTDTSTESPPEAAVTAFRWLNVRAGPGVRSLIVGHLDNGDMVELIGVCVDGWRMIRHDGLEGWVNARYLDGDGGCQ